MIVLFFGYVALQFYQSIGRGSDDATSAPTVAATGVIRRQGFTDYDYGSYV